LEPSASPIKKQAVYVQFQDRPKNRDRENRSKSDTNLAKSVNPVLCAEIGIFPAHIDFSASKTSCRESENQDDKRPKKCVACKIALIVEVGVLKKPSLFALVQRVFIVPALKLAQIHSGQVFGLLDSSPGRSVTGIAFERTNHRDDPERIKIESRPDFQFPRISASNILKPFTKYHGII
jgi:hypothetical protein